MRQDWILNSAALALSFIGSLVVWAATQPRLIEFGLNPLTYLMRHTALIIIGILLGVGVSRMRYTMLRAYVPIVYGLALIGIAAVPFIGKEINGIRAWFQLPLGFTLQPSEFMKIAIVIGVALVLSETHHRHSEPGGREVIISLAVAGVPMGLIMLQPDLGTTLVIAVFVLVLLAASGAHWKWLAGLGGFGSLGALVVLTVPGILSDYQRNRLLVFIDPSLDPLAAGYNLNQARLAIGTGGWTGTGLFNGPQTNGKFVPEQQTDFIFSAAGEELGFLGGGLIIVLLAIVCWRGLKIAMESHDKFGQIAAAGIVGWIAFQTFENIGMNIGLMPVTGVPLPFISYGGSAMFAMWMAIGLLQNIKMKISD